LADEAAMARMLFEGKNLYLPVGQMVAMVAVVVV
jgi:hypothetical protein